MKTLTSIIESVLFVSGEAVAVKDIADKTGYSEKEVLATAKEMQSKYGEDCGINLLIFNKKLQLSSNPNNAEDVSNVLKPIKERELSRSMLEVAAIIAYKQPVTRIDLEELRGSNSEFAIQNLLKLGVIEVVGRKDTVGKPILFGTTDAFLKRFQISSLNELPDYEELLDRISKLRSPTQDSTYLFEKEEYVEESEIKENFIDDVAPIKEEIAVTQVEVKDDADNGDDGEILDFEDEELPDFLKGEDVEIIK